MDATWYVRVIRVRTEDNRWRRPVSSPDPQVRAARNLTDPPPESTSEKKRPRSPRNRGPVVAVTGAATGVGELAPLRGALSDRA
ncbi:NAD-dependent dehydratase, partial [Streptomyces cyaneofuscatus]